MSLGLGSLLLVLIVTTHYAPALLGSLYADPPAATRAWFYVLRGIEGCVLFAAVWAREPYYPAHIRYGVALACTWGMFEEAETAVCRLAVGIERKAEVPLFAGLCDAVTGYPIYMLTLVGLMVVLAAIVGQRGAKK